MSLEDYYRDYLESLTGKPSQDRLRALERTIAQLRQANEQQAEQIARLRARMSEMADRCLDLRNRLAAAGVTP